MTPTIKNRYGEYVEPFEFVVIDSETACRFCQSLAEKGKNLQGMTKEGKKKLAKLYMMKKGTNAIRMIVYAGPIGTGYVCMDCANKLLENLKREIAK